MAEKKVPSELHFEYDGKEYTIKYTKQSFKQLSRIDFDITKIGVHSLAQFSILLWGGLVGGSVKQRNIKLDEAEKIADEFNDKDIILKRLLAMYMQAHTDLMENKGEDGEKLGKITLDTSDWAEVDSD